MKFHDPTEFKREADQQQQLNQQQQQPPNQPQQQQLNQQQQQPPNQPHASEGGSHAHKHGIGEVGDAE